MTSRIIARAGDLVKCENGHVICEVIEDIELGQQNWGSRFGHWRQEEPKIGDLTGWQTCAKCGADIVYWPKAPRQL